VDRSGAGLSLTFTAMRGVNPDSVPPATSRPFDIDFGTPTQLEILLGTNPDGAVPGNFFVTQPTVLILDALRNVVSDQVYTITAQLYENGVPSTKPLFGAKTRLSCPLDSTNVCSANACANKLCGRAVWPNTLTTGLRVDSVGTNYAIMFSAEGLAPVLSYPGFNVASGPPATLHVYEQPTGIYFGRLFTGQPVVVVRDKANNIVPSETSRIIANVVVDGKCCFAPSFAATTRNGFARFTDCSIATVPSYITNADQTITALAPFVQLRFTTDVLTGEFVDSQAFQIATDAVNMSMSVQPALAAPGRMLTVQPEVTLLDDRGRRCVCMYVCMYLCVLMCAYMCAWGNVECAA
jgi:hypothetical protein